MIIIPLCLTMIVSGFIFMSMLMWMICWLLGLATSIVLGIALITLLRDLYK